MVDWTKPIEAVHKDGRVTAAYRMGGGYVLIEDVQWMHYNDGNVPCTPWTLRNVQTAIPADPSDPEDFDTSEEAAALALKQREERRSAYPPELVERMVTLVRKCALVGNLEAKGIVTDLPIQIDPALTEARKLAADFLLHGHGSEGVLDGALDHTPLVQTLVKAFRAGEAK